MDKVTFADIAGYEDEKNQAMKIVNWLKNYQYYKKEGAYLPKGLILSGAPGVGKTMLAKAIANESGAYFVDAKLSGVIELKDTISQFELAFKEAKEHIPSILFLDEIDQLIGRNADGFDSDERHRLVDFLLQELDGSTNSEGVMVIATCNGKYTLPKALLRSGRMDQHIEFDMPDEKNREAILNLYLSRNDRFQKIDTHELAIASNGLQCADLKCICNSVLIKCLDEKKDFAVMSDFEDFIASTISKDIRRKIDIKSLEPYVCYHELSHFAVYYHYNHKPCEIDIAGKRATKGHTRTFDEGNMTYEKRIHQIDICLAGKIGEEIYCNQISVGCGSDIETASSIYQDLAQRTACFGLEKFEICAPESMMADRMEKSDEYRIRRERGQTEFLQQREEIVRKILMEEKPLIDYLYPIIMKKGRLSHRSMSYYLKKYEDIKNKSAQA